jgi:ABC-type antimicrobial peptide transport system permease subunit
LLILFFGSLATVHRCSIDDGLCFDGTGPAQALCPVRWNVRVAALFLAAIGLYGLLAYAVSQRTHEFGLRIALGAQPADVLLSTMCNGAKLITVGVLLGTIAAFALGRLVSKFLFGVRPVDPFTYVGVVVVLLVVGAVAAFLPARRAAAVDPIIALRYE